MFSVAYAQNIDTILVKGEEDSLVILHEVLPTFLTDTAYYFSYELQDSLVSLYGSGDLGTQNNLPFIEKEEVFETPGLMKSGVLSRGISFGNRQDVFVDSRLNLQMEGALTNDIAIRAVISDQDIPYQPEGNTQNVQDLDKVLIEISHEKAKIQAGDLVFQEDSNAYYLQFYKNNQGMQAAVFLPENTTRVGAAIAKGKFQSQWLEVEEGVSGPYRLRGAENERFIVVLANSEKIFLDNKPLNRGYDADYIIDYNTGEITFTPNILITQFSLVRVDFEYSVIHYSRSIVYGDHHFQRNRLGVTARFYQEKDDKNATIQTSLTEADKVKLAEAGNEVDLIFSEDFDTLTEYRLGAYTQLDTIVNGELFEKVYRIASPDDLNFYQVSFLEVGVGKGDYIRIQEGLNGYYFRWEPPLEGVSQGNYSVGKRLVAPNQKQMWGMGVDWKTNAGGKLEAEVVVNDHDQNLLSSKGNEEHQGFALMTGIHQPIKALQIKNQPISVGARWEFTSAGFQAIDRFRDVQFDRDWSLLSSQKAEDHWFKTYIDWKGKTTDLFHLQSAWRQRQEVLSGGQYELRWKSHTSWIDWDLNAFLLNSEERIIGQKANWQRLSLLLSKQLGFWQPGYEYSLDENQNKGIVNDSIQYSAMHFQQHRSFLKFQKNKQFTLLADYKYREDQRPLEGKIERYSKSQTASLRGDFKLKKSTVHLVSTYRSIVYGEYFHGKEEPSFQLKGDWNSPLGTDFISSKISYTTQVSRELKREFQYLPVEPGKGTHTWIDENGDGLQQFNEFYLTNNIDEKNYARFYTPTDEYIPGFGSQLTYRLRFKGSKMKKGDKASPFWKHFDGNLSLLLDQKVIDGDFWSKYFPRLDGNHEFLLSNRTNFRATLFFNKRSITYSNNLQYQYNSVQQLLTQGIERSSTNNWLWNHRLNLNKAHSLQGVLGSNLQNNQSELIEGRDYQIATYSVSPQYIWQAGINWQFQLKAAIKQKENIIGSEHADIHEGIIGMRWGKGGVSSLNTSFQVNLVSSNTEGTTGVQYAMLEGNQQGTNLLWQVNWSQSLMNGLQLTVLYNGRKPSNSPVIHTGNMRVSVLF